MSCCSLSFIFSYFFKNTKTAGPAVSIISVIIIMANMATSYVSLKIRKLIAIFLSPIYICSFIYKIDKMKSHNENLTFNNFIKSDSGYFLLILLANNILYYVLAIVLDIIDNAGGFKFFLLKSFLLKSFLLKGENECNIGYQDDYQKDIQDDETNKNKKCMVEVSGISKIFEKKSEDDSKYQNNSNSKSQNLFNFKSLNIFKSTKMSKFIAVNNVSFNVYQDEIFCILGK